MNNIIDNYETAFEDVDSARYNLTGTDVAFGTADDSGNNIHADPLFKSAVALDLHLTPDSPAVNAAYCGYFSACAAEDFEGDSRPKWGAYDMGADEFDLKILLPFMMRTLIIINPG